MIVVSDTSPLIGFAILGMLDILDKIFRNLVVPSAVYNEVSEPGKPYSDELKRFLKNKVKPVKNVTAVSLLEKEIDLGEAESIVLAIENGIEDILIDEFKGRRAAKAHGLAPIGTVGVLLKAKELNLIKKVKPLLDELMRNRIRIGIPLYRKGLELAGELEE